MTTIAGYSGTPLIKKLGVKDGYRYLFADGIGGHQSVCGGRNVVWAQARLA
jgi:hypothetical protein